MKKKGDLADPLEGETEVKVLIEEYLPIPETREEDGDPQLPETASLPRIEMHTEIQSLKCLLTQDEIKQCGERMARAEGEKRDHETTLKSVVSQYKAEIDKSAAVISSEAEKIRSGYEFRPVDIKVEMDYSRGNIMKARTDTFEVLEDRKMTDYEAQRKIKF